MLPDCEITSVCEIPSSTPSLFVIAAVVALVVLAVAAVVLLILWRTTASQLRSRGTTGTVAVPQAAAPSIDMGLVDRLIDLADLATSPAVAAQTERVLRYLDVEPVPAVIGELLNPTLHSVASTEPTTDPLQHERIVAVVRTGWQHDGVVIRPADVTVWVGR